MDPRGDRTARGTVFQGDAPTEFCTSHTAETTVTVCLDCPILDGNGEETGLYHLAGEFCPEESRQEVSLLGYQREDVGGAGAEDAKYFLGVTQEAGPVRSTLRPSPTGSPFDPNQPWDPSDPWNPNTNPLDPTGAGRRGCRRPWTGGPGRASGRRDGGPQRDGPYHQPGDREALRILNKKRARGASLRGPVFRSANRAAPICRRHVEPLVISIFYLEKDLSW